MTTINCFRLAALTAFLTIVEATTPALGSSAGPALDKEVLGWHQFRGVSVTSSDHAFAVGNRGLYRRGRIKEWDGRTWTNARTGLGMDAMLAAVDAVSDSDAWAVGTYTDHREGTGMHALTVHWDGHRWRNVRGPQPNEQRYLSDVSMLSADDAWAVGNTGNVPEEGDTQTLVKHWNGRRWADVPSPNPDPSYNILNTVAAIAPSDVWAAGTTSLEWSTLMMHWDGAQWRVVDAPLARLVDMTALSANDVWAVGYRQVDGHWTPTIEHWNGKRWGIVPSPDPGSPEGDFLTGVSAVSTNDVWVVGYGRDGFEYPSRTLIEHWDGQKWRVVESPNPGTVQNGLAGVSASAPDEAWAVGLSADQGAEPNKSKPLFLHWDGTAWTRTSSMATLR